MALFKTGVDPGMPTEAFVNLLSEKTGVPVSAIEILTGFPPKLVKVRAHACELSSSC